MRQQVNQTERNKKCHLYVRNESLLQLLAPLLSMTQPAAAAAPRLVNLSDSNTVAPSWSWPRSAQSNPVRTGRPAGNLPGTNGCPVVFLLLFHFGLLFSVFSFVFCNVYCCRCHTIVVRVPPWLLLGFFSVCVCGLCNIVEFFAGQAFHLDCCSHRH